MFQQTEQYSLTKLQTYTVSLAQFVHFHGVLADVLVQSAWF